MTEPEPTITLPIDVVAALFDGCHATVAHAADGWEDGDELQARFGVEAMPVWALDQVEAHRQRHYQHESGRCGTCGGDWPCGVARLRGGE